MLLCRHTTVTFRLDLTEEEQFRFRPHHFARTRIITTVRVDNTGYVELLGHPPGNELVDTVKRDIFGNTYFDPADVAGLPEKVRVLLPALRLEAKHNYEDIPTRR